MPCYDPQAHQDDIDSKAAACEMARAIFERIPELLPTLSKATLRWIEEHRQLDARLGRKWKE